MKKKRYEIIIFMFFLVVLSVILLKIYYKNQVFDLGKSIFPSGENNYSFFNGIRIKGTDGIKTDSNVNLELSPGQDFNGVMILKNHRNFERHFLITPHDFILSESSKDSTSKIKSKSITPNLILYDKNILLPGDGVEFVDYKIVVPQNIKPGLYSATLQAMVNDETAEKKMHEGVLLGVALGSKITVNILDAQSSIEYEKVSNIVFDHANARLIAVIRLAAGIALLILTCYFIHKAFRKK